MKRMNTTSRIFDSQTPQVPDISKKEVLNYSHYGVIADMKTFHDPGKKTHQLTIVIPWDDERIRCRYYINSDTCPEYRKLHAMFWDHQREDDDFYCLNAAVSGKLVIVTLKMCKSGKIYIDTLQKATFESESDKRFMEEFQYRVMGDVTSYTSDMEPYHDWRKIKKIIEINDLK